MLLKRSELIETINALTADERILAQAEVTEGWNPGGGYCPEDYCLIEQALDRPLRVGIDGYLFDLGLAIDCQFAKYGRITVIDDV